MSYVFSFTFFSLPLIFTLHWWPLAFPILSPPLPNRYKSEKTRPVKRARESGEDEDYEAPPPSPLPSPSLCSLRSPIPFQFHPVFCLFPPTTQPGPRLMLWWFYNKDQFKFKRLKDGRCTCKKTGSSHLNAGFLVVVATLWRHTVNDPIYARGVFLIL